ncbi:tRNA (adenosine(37)-N6)-threonylcarbamoyltransferase complex ATPase subunit type 1 TsaE [Dictyobacter alpinus]|uniref:tRNA threonylcarbamoyladenosine biosynthesis protein TsaE n=1 Tax=Dictyobacter alpinus TaxID=2014873 RepID=A0A402B9H1_9CHLR|nr:tRNA (adenosine(37)-N6)-threonylcarbamoyltransferase complex ATPase subunit type 1 TsaE [Dictyobacter alpinus]GCE27985.1 tRNA (adenosine(37)-N6)-threonylcarbamoyltransferase complex ATPase subunit type 1 TsaE [Dictyobacter alpinus]
MREERDADLSVQDGSCSLEVVSQRASQTQRLGMALGALLQAGDLILLDGQLGAGKTTFTQGLAKGMNVTDVVNSPTFTLLKEYMGSSTVSQAQDQKNAAGAKLALYHFDLYRLDDPDEIIDLGFEDYFYGSGVCVVEWAGKADELWPVDRLYIHLSSVDETKRRLLFVATGARYCELLQQLQKNMYAITRS